MENISTIQKAFESKNYPFGLEPPHPLEKIANDFHLDLEALYMYLAGFRVREEIACNTFGKPVKISRTEKKHFYNCFVPDAEGEESWHSVVDDLISNAILSKEVASKAYYSWKKSAISQTGLKEAIG